MSPDDRRLAQKLDAGLKSFSQEGHPMPGIENAVNRDALLRQLIESIRRIRYISVIQNRDVSILRADPSSKLFDPIKAAVLHQHQGNVDEAFWMVFLSVHFGKKPKSGWNLVRMIYARDGGALPWNWNEVSSNASGFRQWLASHQNNIRRYGGGFGNHRKYQSLDAYAPKGTGDAIESYVKWVGPKKSHQALVQAAQLQNSSKPQATFDTLYHSMATVTSFGRTAKFDYLTMVGKLGLANIEPGSPYLAGSTGPLSGARLLLGKNKTAVLDQLLVQLGAHLNVGMQVLEDALCNWQKSPAEFKPFRG